MGDVIMTLPVVRAFLATYPDEKLVFLTKKPFDLFFNNIPGVTVVVARHHDRHKGIRGLFRLYRDIREDHNIDIVVDLHNVLRSKILRTLFLLSGCRTSRINKGRREKRRLIAGRINHPLKHTVIRYADTFERSGYRLKMTEGPWLLPPSSSSEVIASIIPGNGSKLVGVAPLAKHELKMWPLEKMTEFLNRLASSMNVTIFLFGSPDEVSQLEKYSAGIPGCITVAGKVRLAEEMTLMSKLDLMIAMDSSNMHLATMLGVRTISIWGGTHPWAGFSGWNSSMDDAMQISRQELECRPCTIFGKGKCRRGDLACFNWLDPSVVLKKVIALLSDKKQ